MSFGSFHQNLSNYYSAKKLLTSKHDFFNILIHFANHNATDYAILQALDTS